jgi:hypothetical protein
MQQYSMTPSFLARLLFALLLALPLVVAAAPPADTDSSGGQADSAEERPTPAEPSPESSAEAAPVVIAASEPEVIRAADHVQKALDRLATSQALVIASEDGQDAAARAELSLQLLEARRSLERALVAIGKLEGAGDLRALLEESGLVLTEGERATVLVEQERLRGLSAERFQQVVAAMTSIAFSEGRMQQLKAELKEQSLTSAQSWALVELFDFSRDRVEALVFLHPKIVDPENFAELLSGLKFESDRETVRSRLGLEG